MSQLRQALGLACTMSLCSLPLLGQLESGDLLIVDAGTDRVLQYDASTGTISESFDQNDFKGANSGTAPVLSGEIHYDDHQAYLYLSGTGGNSRLYRADVGNNLVSLANRLELMDLQTVPEAAVSLTGKAIPVSGLILLADKGVTNGSIYSHNLRTGTQSLYATEQDYITFSSGSGSGMTDLDFVSLVYQEDIANYWLLSGGSGLDSGGNNRSVIFRVGSDGLPLQEFAVSGIDEDWHQIVQTASGDFHIFQTTGGSPSIITVDTLGSITTLLSSADLESIFGPGVVVSESLAIDTSGLLYLLGQDGAVYSVDPSNPGGIGVANTAVQIVSAQDYIDDTTAAVTDALGLAFVPAAPVSYTVTERSEPANLVTTKVTTVVENRYYTVALPPIISSGRHLSFWSLNGVREASATGRGLFRPTFIVTEDIDAVAQYYEIGVDGDGDRMEDWWEFWMFGDRTQGPQDDIDGDGFDHETEFNRGLDATLVDQKNAGGVSARLSHMVDFVESGVYRYVIESEPFGILQVEKGQLLPGQSITTPYLFSALAGHEFVGWEVDGTPVRSPDGVYLNQITVTPSADTRIVARFILTNEDSDSDGIADSFEWQQYGNLSYTGSSDPEGDGFDIDYEISHGMSVVHPDVVNRGGISARLSSLVTYVQGKSLYSVQSLPLGIIPTTSEYVDDGTVKTTAYYSQILVAGYEFAYWSVNGARIADPSGVALRQVTTTVNGATQVIAHFISPTRDNDADGILDVTELHYLGTLAHNRNSNPDGDAFTLGEEIDYGYSLSRHDTKRPGGIAARTSQIVLFNNSTMVKLDFKTSPLGIAASTSDYYETGTEIVSTRYQFAYPISGFYFTHYTVNGTRVTDSLGNARTQAIFDITEDTELVAHFTSSTADVDADGILDYVEMRVAGSIGAIAPGDDPDGDGITVGEELQLGYGILGHDTKRPGGISGRMGNLFTLDFENPPLVVDIPDPALKTVVANALGLDPEGDILVADMLNLTSLDASGLKISTVRGLEAATNLTSLYLNDNRITDIRPLAYLTLLQDDQNGAGLRIQGNFIDFTDPRQAAPLDALLVINNLTVERDPQYPQGQVTVVTDSGHPRAIVDGDLTMWVNPVSQSDIAYRWFKDGALIPGEITPSLSLNTLVLEDSGAYEIQMTDVHGTFSKVFDVTVLRKAQLTVNIRDGLGMWRFTTPWDNSDWLPSGTTYPGLAETDVAEIEFQPVVGRWTPRMQEVLVPGNNIYDVAYLEDPLPYTALGEIDIISRGFDLRTDIRGGAHDGSVLLGNFDEGGVFDASLWTPSRGLEPAPDLPNRVNGFTFITGMDASADGYRLAGREYEANGKGVPVVYTRELNGYSVEMLPINGADPATAGNVIGRALGISEDGLTICGHWFGQGAVWNYNETLQEWEQPILTGFGQWESQPQWQFKGIWLFDLSADGSTAAGWISLWDGTTRYLEPLVWKDGSLEPLPYPAGAVEPGAYNISRDGLSISGDLIENGETKVAIWNWNAGTASWDLSLYPLPDTSRATSVTKFIDDNSILSVTTFDPSDGLNPATYILDPLNGFQPVRDWLWNHFRIDFGQDWIPELQYANLNDGVVFGNLLTPWGDRQAFRIISQAGDAFGQLNVNIDSTDGQPFMWRIDGGPWQESNITVWAPAGPHEVEFMNLPGYSPIDPVQVDITADTTLQLDAQTGALGTVGLIDPVSTGIIPNNLFVYYRAIDDGNNHVWVSGNGATAGLGDIITGPIARLNSTTGELDPAFQSHLGEGQAFLYDVFPDGSALVSSYHDWRKSDYMILKLLPTGEPDPEFRPYLSDSVRIAKVLPDGKILLGQTIAGTDRAVVTRLQPNGIPDPTWHEVELTKNITGFGFNTNVWAKFIVDDQGRVLIGGTFTEVDGEPRPGIARLLPTGELDNTFIPQTVQVQDFPVRAIGLQSDGKVVFGPLTKDAALTLPANYPLVRLMPNGDFDYGFNMEGFYAVPNSRVRDMIVLDDDTMVIAGDHGVVKLLPDGDVDPGFAPVVSTLPEFSGTTDYPDVHFWISEAPGGYYVAGSLDTTISEFKDLSYVHYGLYKTNEVGIVDTNFNPPQPFTLSYPNVLLPVSSTDVLITGKEFPSNPMRVGLLPVDGASIIDTATGLALTADSFNSQIPAENGFLSWIDIRGNSGNWYGLYAFDTGTDSGTRLARGSANGVIDPLYDVGNLGDTGATLSVINLDPYVAMQSTSTDSLVIAPDGSFTRATVNHYDQNAQLVGSLDIGDLLGEFDSTPTIGLGEVRVWDKDAQGNLLVSLPDASGYPVLAKFTPAGEVLPSFTPLVFVDSGTVTESWSTGNIYNGAPVLQKASLAKINVVTKTGKGTYLVGGQFSEVRAYADFLQTPSTNPVPGNASVYSGSPLIEIHSNGQLVSNSPVLNSMEMYYPSDNDKMAVHDIVMTEAYGYIIGVFDHYRGYPISGVVRLFNGTLNLDPTFTHGLRSKDYHWTTPVSRGTILPSGDLMVLGQFIHPAQLLPSPVTIIDLPANPVTWVNFADNGLRAAVKQALGLGTTDPINATELAMLQSLDVTGQSVVNLSGLQYAVNLRDLDLSGNNIADITSLQSLTHLETVDLQYNYLDTTPGSDDRNILDSLSGQVLYATQNPSLTTYEEWAQDNGIIIEESDPFDTTGAYGIMDIDAYAMGLDPDNITAEDLPKLELNGEYFEYIYSINLNAIGVDLRIECSIDLITWEEVDPLNVEILSDDGNGLLVIKITKDVQADQIYVRRNLNFY